MQTSFNTEFLQTTEGRRVNDILRSCVHCGFCNATCPTFQLTGNELDGPRGRIYLIKNLFEENQPSPTSMKHLDRCLTCLSCETTCPSGVKYGELIDFGRKKSENLTKRPWHKKLKRKLIIFIFSNHIRTALILWFARIFKPFLPSELGKKIPIRGKKQTIRQVVNATRHMLVLSGCVQSNTAPQFNAAAAKLLSQSNIQLQETKSNCCGALAFHLSEISKAKQTIRDNLDEWYALLKNTHDILLVTSSGCSAFIKQYMTIMCDEPEYSEQAKFVTEHCRDLSEILNDLQVIPKKNIDTTVALHSPCTLQHAQKLGDSIKNVLQQAGYEVVIPKDAHICCGSAGSYSLLEPDLSSQLLKNKISDLEVCAPDIIVTANIGCYLHLKSGTNTPVKHWVELLV